MKMAFSQMERDSSQIKAAFSQVKVAVRLENDLVL